MMLSTCRMMLDVQGFSWCNQLPVQHEYNLPRNSATPISRADSKGFKKHGPWFLVSHDVVFLCIPWHIFTTHRNRNKEATWDTSRITSYATPTPLGWRPNLTIMTITTARRRQERSWHERTTTTLTDYEAASAIHPLHSSLGESADFGSSLASITSSPEAPAPCSRANCGRFIDKRNIQRIGQNTSV